jgi:hypothetical protein
VQRADRNRTQADLQDHCLDTIGTVLRFLLAAIEHAAEQGESIDARELLRRVESGDWEDNAVYIPFPNRIGPVTPAELLKVARIAVTLSEISGMTTQREQKAHNLLCRHWSWKVNGS